jgi:hypothetical protein
MSTTITRDELTRLLDAGTDVTFVETLRAEHFDQAHLPGAVHLHFETGAVQAHDLGDLLIAVAKLAQLGHLLVGDLAGRSDHLVSLQLMTGAFNLVAGVHRAAEVA